MTDLDSDLAARIAAIRQEFLARMKADWLPNLSALRDRYLISPGDEALLNQMLHAAHDMSGSGAIFGYQEISNQGRRLEDSLRAVIRHTVEDTTERHGEILALIDQLEQVCRAALADLKGPEEPSRSA